MEVSRKQVLRRLKNRLLSSSAVHIGMAVGFMVVGIALCLCATFSGLAPFAMGLFTAGLVLFVVCGAGWLVLMAFVDMVAYTWFWKTADPMRAAAISVAGFTPELCMVLSPNGRCGECSHPLSLLKGHGKLLSFCSECDQGGDVRLKDFLGEKAFVPGLHVDGLRLEHALGQLQEEDADHETRRKRLIARIEALPGGSERLYGTYRVAPAVKRDADVKVPKLYDEDEGEEEASLDRPVDIRA